MTQKRSDNKLGKENGRLFLILLLNDGLDINGVDGNVRRGPITQAKGRSFSGFSFFARHITTQDFRSVRFRRLNFNFKSMDVAKKFYDVNFNDWTVPP